MSKELNQYGDFVASVTSAPSLDANQMIARILELNAIDGVNIAQLLTGGMGLTSESGEVGEILKKILWQNSPLDENKIYHLKRELGDVIFYWIETVLSIGADPYEIINMNIEKLQARYPGGKFTIYHSENRKQDDI